MNLQRAFVSYLETLLGLTFGQDIFVGQAPSSLKAPDDLWWIVASGGAKDSTNNTGESIKSYQVDIFRRARDYETVYDDMQNLEEQLNCSSCITLEGYDVIDAQATAFPIDNDLDSEDRKLGLLQATIRVHKEC